MLIPTVALIETFISLRLAGRGTGAVADGEVTVQSVCMRVQLSAINSVVIRHRSPYSLLVPANMGMSMHSTVASSLHPLCILVRRMGESSACTC